VLYRYMNLNNEPTTQRINQVWALVVVPLGEPSPRHFDFL
jgi:hypothetical protein